MKPQNELALIVAYYLSRLDKEGYSSLGYKNFNSAAHAIGSILGVKPNTVKNMRDEFDPYHQNSRIGWKKELRGSRLKILQAFQNTDDETLFEIVKEILFNDVFIKTEEYEDIRALFGEKNSSKGSIVYIVRGPTGKAAESFFMEYFKKSAEPVSGKLIDTRDLGCGYDFQIQNEDGLFFVEVKGLSLNDGGILFTNKEWQTAKKYGDRYYLAIVKNISVGPTIIFIHNPATKLSPNKQIYTTLQISWNIAMKNLI